MSHVSYPSQLSVDCVKDVIAIVTSGQVVNQRTRLAHCLWNLQGSLQKILLGDPDSDLVMSVSSDVDMDLLEGSLIRLEETTMVDPKMDIGTIILLVKTVLELIKAWRESK